MSESVPRLLELCPDCGYALVGLPAHGNCPECGREYDQSVMILPGSARGGTASLADASGSRLVWEIIIIALMFSSFFWDLWRGHVQPLMYAAIAFILPGYALTLFDRFTRRRPGLVHVYINANGCLQVRANQRTLWTRIALGCFIVGSVFFAASFLNEYLPISEPEIRRGIALSVPALYCAWFVWKVRHAFLPHDEVQPALHLAYAGVPWRDLSIARFEPLGDDRFLLRLQHRHKKSLLRQPADVIHAELQCSKQQALTAVRLIKDWITDDRPPEPGGADP